MIEALTEALLMAGVIQFGHFVDQAGEVAPIRLHFALLPAYPSLLRQATQAMRVHVDPHIQRLVCPQDSLPLGVCLSIGTGIPLVYSSRDRDGVDQLVGAYDVGHPALLIGSRYSASDAVVTGVLKSRAAHVGLNIVSELYLFGLTEKLDPSVRSLIVLNTDLLDRWIQQGWLTTGQGTAVHQWLEREAPREATSHHRG